METDELIKELKLVDHPVELVYLLVQENKISVQTFREVISWMAYGSYKVVRFSD